MAVEQSYNSLPPAAALIPAVRPDGRLFTAEWLYPFTPA
jgi:hypothetical protein